MLNRDLPRGWIVILDVDDFVQWIEKTPFVLSWATAELKLGSGQFGRSLEHAWKGWAHESVPQLSEALVSAGRDLGPISSALKTRDALIATVQADSASEAMGLVYCGIRSLAESDSKSLLANTLVVYDAAAAEELSVQSFPAESTSLVVLMPAAARKSQLLVSAGHRVIHVNGRSGRNASALTFVRASVTDFKKALVETMEVVDLQAEIEAKACGCSVSVWQIRNLHQRSISSSLPEWSEVEHADIVVPAVFLGGWNEDSAPDKNLVQELTGLNAGVFFSRVQRFGICDDPLFEVISTERAVIAPTAAFAFVARHITSVHLEKLRQVCIQNFSTISPEVSARWEGRESEQRIIRRQEEFSEWVLDGLAETLLRIAVLDRDLVISGAISTYGSGQEYVNRLVRDLPGLRNDPRVMASLGQRLPVLAEAATGPFVEALESLLQGDVSRLRLWLGDEGGIFGRSFHTGLLWALETIAWSPAYLGQTSLILAKFADIDPGGQLSNRPLNSLRNIFLAWHPQTSASLQARVNILRELLLDVPEIAWKLLVKLLPESHQMATPTARPIWRDFGQTSRSTITRSEVADAYREYIDLTLDAATGNLPRLADVARQYENLSEPQQVRFEELVRTAANNTQEPGDQYSIWHTLHQVIVRHRGFADAEWAMQSAELDRLERIADIFASSDLVIRHKWLFDDQLPETGHPETDHDGWEADVRSKRVAAIESILDAEGWSGIHRLVRLVGHPYVVGNKIAEIVRDSGALIEALDAWRVGGTRAEQLALQSAAASRLGVDGEAWTTELLSMFKRKNWPEAEIARALMDYPDSTATFELVDSLGEGVATHYWGNRYAFVRHADQDPDAFQIAVDKFVANSRAADLVDMNRPHLQKLGYEPALKVVDAMIEQMSRGIGPRHNGTFDYDVQELFKWLRRQPESSEQEIARREYSLLPLFTYAGKVAEPLALHNLMATDAAFFVDVLCDLYKPASGERERSVLSKETAEKRAHAAFSLLHSWKVPPGVSGEAVDADSLKAWVEAARRIAKSKDREEIADQEIGALLFHVPKGSDDGIWPNLAIRELLEKLRSAQIERGMQLEAYNSRGVTSRGMLEGGKKERKLEDFWRARAKLLGSRWPRARRVCNAIADGWVRDAEHADNEVKKRRAQWSR